MAAKLPQLLIHQPETQKGANASGVWPALALSGAELSGVEETCQGTSVRVIVNLARWSLDWFCH